ncbi:MAG TPA: hypothetical protein VHT30_13090 [Acidimicrobiales bacterium]|nr:hypothetical protein [Acidimicrobiales bacterium]
MPKMLPRRSRRLAAIVVAFGLTTAAMAGSAAAATSVPTVPHSGGCGINWHRNRRGICVPNKRPRVAQAALLG